MPKIMSHISLSGTVCRGLYAGSIEDSVLRFCVSQQNALIHSDPESYGKCLVN